jgi:hypothetical protein
MRTMGIKRHKEGQRDQFDDLACYKFIKEYC